MTAGAERTDVDVHPPPTPPGKPPGRLGIRHLQVVLLFLGMIIGYCLRVSMSEAIVAMSNESHPGFKSYNWTPTEKGLVLSSFFWGYTITQIPSGYVAGVWSAHRLLSIGIISCGVLNVITPVAVSYGGLIAICGCRVGMGLAQGCLLPCTHTLLSKWAPPDERARLGTFAYAGAQLGTVVAFPISGYLAGSNAGWPAIFYFFGALGIIWGLGFYVFGSDCPRAHKMISPEERYYIEQSLRPAQDGGDDYEGKLRTPWLSIMTSLPMWALIVVHCGQNWGYWTLLTNLPNYIHAILGTDIQKNGGLSALPYLAMWLLSFPVSWLSDFALKKGVSRAVTRKVSNTIAHWGPAIALFCLAFFKPQSETVTVAILVVAVGLNAGSLCGFQINHIDLSPNFAGTMMSITNCLASVVAILAPIIAGMIVTDERNVSQWAIVFYLSAAIYFLGNLVFVILGKAEVRKWNQPKRRPAIA